MAPPPLIVFGQELSLYRDITVHLTYKMAYNNKSTVPLFLLFTWVSGEFSIRVTLTQILMCIRIIIFASFHDFPNGFSLIF